MKLIALMPVRNEDWVLGLSLRAALYWCDEVCVLLHCSVDGSRDIVEEVAAENPGRVWWDEFFVGSDFFPEVMIRNRLLEMGRRRGGTHFALVDADEVLCGSDVGKIRPTIDALPSSYSLTVPMKPLWRSLWSVRVDDCVWTGAWVTVGFRDDPQVGGWKSRDGYEWHHRHPFGTTPVRDWSFTGVMHLQFTNWRRLRAKHAWYKMMERLRVPDKSVEEIDTQYSMALNETGLVSAEVPVEWWKPYLELMKHVHLDREPWFEEQVRRWWEQYGPERFQGLNLFGVVEC